MALLLSAFVLLVAFKAAADDLQPIADHGPPIGPPAMLRIPAVLEGPAFDLQDPLAPGLTGSFEGINFDDNHVLSGQYYIPPDPIAAAGPNHVVAVVNSAIEWYTKSGTRQYRQSLYDFFAPLTPQDDPFDPKVIYDQYTGRYFVVCLVKIDNGAGSPSNISRILVAVSDNNDPNGTWYLSSIDSKLTINPAERWADFPGLRWTRRPSTLRRTCLVSGRKHSVVRGSGSSAKGMGRGGSTTEGRSRSRSTTHRPRPTFPASHPPCSLPTSSAPAGWPRGWAHFW